MRSLRKDSTGVASSLLQQDIRHCRQLVRVAGEWWAASYLLFLYDVLDVFCFLFFVFSRSVGRVTLQRFRQGSPYFSLTPRQNSKFAFARLYRSKG